MADEALVMKYKKDFMWGVLVGMIYVVIQSYFFKGSAGLIVSSYINKYIPNLVLSILLGDVLVATLIFMLMKGFVSKDKLLTHGLCFALGNFTFYSLLAIGFFFFARPNFF